MEETIKAPYFDGSQPCAQIGGDLWFPDENGDMHGASGFLKKVCGSCEFKEACFNYAITHNVEGFWAGTSAVERKKYRSKHNIKVIPYAYSRIHDIDDF